MSGSLADLPDTKKLDQKVVAELGEESLTEEEDVGRQRRLKHDWHVRGVEEADWVRSTHATLARRLDWDLNAETLEVDNSTKDGDRSQEVHDVWQVLSVKGLAKSELLVWPSDQKVDKSDNGTLELWSSSGVDGGWGESLPDNGLANVGCNEERDTATKTVALLEKLVQENDDQGCSEKLNDEEDTDTSAEVGWLTVETSKDVDTGLTERENDCKKLFGLVVVHVAVCNGAYLLSGLVKLAVRLQVEVDIDEVSTGEKLIVLAVSLLFSVSRAIPGKPCRKR